MFEVKMKLRKKIIFICAIIFYIVNCGNVWATHVSHQKAVEFTSCGLNIKLASPSSGMGFSGMIVNDKSFVKASGRDDAMLWKIVMTSDVTNDKSFFGLTNLNKTGYNSAEVFKDRIILKWNNLDIPGEKNCLDVKVTILRKGSSGLGEWRINVANRSRKAGIFRVVFPVIDFVKIGNSGKDDYLMLPFAEGYLAKDPIGVDKRGISRGYWEVATDGKPTFKQIKRIKKSAILAARPGGLPYPSMAGQMQVLAYYEKSGNFYYPDKAKGTGVYIATYDSAPYPKVFFVTPKPQKGIMTYELANYPDESSRPGKGYNMPYPMLLGALKGDWYDAAVIYRKWAVKQKWASKGKLIDRKDVPEWLKKTTTVLRFDNWRKDNKKLMKEAEFFRKHIKGTIIAQWYNWDEPENNAYSFPPVVKAVDNFKEIVEELRRKNIYAMPYFNARIYGDGADGYDKAKPFFATKRDGSIPGLKVGKKLHPYACVQSSFWQNLHSNLADKIVKKYNLDSLYLDQAYGSIIVGQLTPGKGGERGGCYNPEHKHPLGITRSLIAAEHKRIAMLLKAARKTCPEMVLCGEGNDEMFIDIMSSRLLPSEIWNGYVPLFQTVYHDYITSYGRRVDLMASKDPGDPLPAMQIGWQLTMGNQIGRIFLWKMHTMKNPVVIKHLGYLNKASEVRERWRDYFCTGQMLCPPYIKGKIPNLTTRQHWSRNSITLPAILASTWKDDSGNIAMLITNISEKPITFEFSVDIADLDLQSNSIKFRQVYPLRKDFGFARGKSVGKKITLPGLSIVVWELYETGSADFLHL
jgi:hypothetical protein